MCEKITKVFRIVKNAFLDIKETIFESNEDKEESEYTALTPIDDIENGIEYFNAIDWALNQQKVKNIALAGPYGSGKSSIIDTYLKNNPSIKRESLRISMATFEKESDGEKIAFHCEDIEKEILKQLFYKVNHKRIPRSRYRKLYKIATMNVFLATCAIFVFGLLVLFIFWPDILNIVIEKIVAAAATFNLSKNFSLGITAFILIILAVVASKLYIHIFSHFALKGLNLPQNISIEKEKNNSEDIFNKNLDEIVYFFEETKYRIVFFEDFDRLNEPTIFVRLRELNNVLNNCDEISKNIVFVYAVRDDLFKGNDRTKFFDFIIPVVPVINSTNSGEILVEKLLTSDGDDKKYNISQDFILDVSPYISDMRVLQNICNEFIVYKATLNKEQNLELLDEPMLALMIFKNLYPKDFAELQNETGIIKQAFDNKMSFIKLKNEDIEKDNEKRLEKIGAIQNEYVTSRRDLKIIFLSSLSYGRGMIDQFYAQNVGYVNTSNFLDDSFNIDSLKKVSSCHGNYRSWSGSSQSFTCSDFGEKYSNFVKRLAIVSEIENSNLFNIQTEIEKTRDEQQKLTSYSLSKLIDSYGIDLILPDSVKQNKLLVFLLRRGYINEKYVNYINYFKGNTVTNADMNFILSVKNVEPKEFEHKLNKIEMVVQRLQLYEFEQKAIYNFDLLNYLLSTDKYDDKLNVLIEQLSDESDVSFSFINSFVDLSPHRERFFEILTMKWTGIWDYIYENTVLTYDRKCYYLSLIISNASDDSLIAINSNGRISNFFTANKDIFTKLPFVCLEKIIHIISMFKITFCDFDIYGVDDRILNYIFDNNYYDINQCMIEKIVEYKNKSLYPELNTANYSTLKKLGYIPLLDYIKNNIDYYTSTIVLSEGNSNEDVDAMLELLQLNVNNQENARGIIGKSNFCINNFNEVCLNLLDSNENYVKNICDEILINNKIKATWENIYLYWNNFVFTDYLAKFINQNINNLLEDDISHVNDEKFIYDLIKSSVDDVSFSSIIEKFTIEEFKLALSDINETRIKIMVSKGFFKFEVELFNEINELYPVLGKEFILQNQDDYMDVHNQINMDNKLFEFLVCSTRFDKKHKESLLIAYTSLINETIAKILLKSDLDISISVFKRVWSKLDAKNKKDLMYNYLSILSAKDFEICFSELEKPYCDFTDRNRRIEICIDYTAENIKLAGRLKEVNYITSYTEKTAVQKGKGKSPSIKILACKIKV